MATDPRRVIIGTITKPARSTFMFCRELQKPDDPKKADAPARCRTSILFSKDDEATYDRVMDAIIAAGEKKFGKDFNVNSKRISIPLMDGDELADDPEYSVGEEARGMWFISSSAYKLPQVVDRDNQRIIDPDDLDDCVRSGNYFLFSVTMKGFDNESRGVRCELNNLMFVKEGDRLDGGASAEQDFAEFAEDEPTSSRRGRNDDDSRSSRRRGSDDDDEPRSSRRRGRSDDDEPRGRSDDDDEPRGRRGRDRDDAPRSRRRRGYDD
ncbi:hypothetical protein KPP23_020 [Pseudomonas phage KPP23]|nr:hypothetical protein KPP23_020 [Pseudomonas phage KPP23]